ncbi:MAG: phosphoesterase PA-phosphatase related protein [Parcubacteria group bacterium]|nr:phosphoesterase PA-phosphatase related protein [Parcubacteria group bacterium]
MKDFFSTLLPNFAKSFTGKHVYLHVAAIVLTFFIVESGFDWWWYIHTSGTAFERFFFPAVFLGAVIPLLVPLAFVLLGRLKDKRLHMTGWALGQAALLGSGISSLYKIFTGRLQPTHASFSIDVSHDFQFGFLKHGVFWGWPSSHTTIAFAMAVTFVVMYRKSKVLATFALLYAFYIGIGVSMNVHWFSEFVAGSLIGTAIGLAVGKHFHQYTNR